MKKRRPNSGRAVIVNVYSEPRFLLRFPKNEKPNLHEMEGFLLLGVTDTYRNTVSKFGHLDDVESAFEYFNISRNWCHVFTNMWAVYRSVPNTIHLFDVTRFSDESGSREFHGAGSSSTVEHRPKKQICGGIGFHRVTRYAVH